MRPRPCPVCGGVDRATVLHLHATPLGDLLCERSSTAVGLPAYPLDLALCTSCGHLHLPSVVAPEESYSNYHFHTGASPGLAPSMRALAEELWRTIEGRAGELVLDIGSNDGTWLAGFAALGARVQGVEPAAGQAQRAAAAGVTTINDYFSASLAGALKDDGLRPRLITANYVAANIPDVDDFFAGLRTICPAEGRVALLTGYHPDQFAVAMFDYAYHEHVSYFTVRDVHNLCLRHGFRIDWARRVPLKGGSLLAVLAPESAPEAPEHVRRMLQFEDWLGVRTHGYFAALNARLATASERLHGLLTALGPSAAGMRTLPGYGMSHSVTTLVYQFELSEHLAFLVDDNPRRQGLFSPGLGLAVRDPSVLITEQHPSCLVLAWQHDERIIERLRVSGWTGTAIIPLPDPHLIRIQ